MAPIASAQSAETVVLEPVTPAISKPVLRSAVLPGYVVAGVEVDIAGEVLIGNWQQTGTIIDISGEQITFENSEGKTDQVIFRMHVQPEFRFKIGQSINIIHTSGFAAKSHFFQFAMDVENEPVFAARRAHFNASPTRETLLSVLPSSKGLGLSLVIAEDQKALENEIAQGTTFEIPIQLQETSTRQILANISAQTTSEIEIKGKSVTFDLETSSQFVPSQLHRSFTPGGYVIEYFIAIKK